MKEFIVTLVLLLTALPAAAADACPDAHARDFDFWLGDWNIQQKFLQPDGTWIELPAHTSVARALDGCALVEHWQGQVQFFWEGMEAPEPMRGLSVRAFDSDAGFWRIYWMDTRSPRFAAPFEGTFADGRGEFFRTRDRPQGPQQSRITFSHPAPDAVHWDLALSNDGGETWTTLWIMDMRRPTTSSNAESPD